MTSAELIHKIRRKVKELQDEFISIQPKDCSLKLIKSYAGYAYLDKVLSFLSTLESENPVPNDLEEAANKFAVFYDQGTCDGIAQDCFIAGAKWQADHTPLPEDTVLFQKGVEEGRRLAEEEQADLFTIVALDAAQRAKEQMMKDAVEGTIDDCGTPARLRLEMPGGSFRIGDKVRVIVCKKED